MPAAADMVPEQKMSRHIPSEIVEEILVNLRVKPLLRFSSVSKSWNSIISDPKFAIRHRRRAVRERMVIGGDCLMSALFSSISVVDDSNATPRPLICPFMQHEEVYDSGINILASCGDLWCVAHANSMYLWNPSTNAYTKLPPTFHYNSTYVYGLGYDSLGDDYKIVKIFMKPYYGCKHDHRRHFDVYSLRSDSWRRIEPNYPDEERKGLLPFGGCVALHGALHWLQGVTDDSNSHIIAFFNLSTDKYAEVAVPQVSQPYSCRPEITVLRGKLCMHRTWSFTFILWEMREYGVAESWTKTFVIDDWNIFSSKGKPLTPSSLRPLYIYEDGKLLITVDGCIRTTMFIYVDEKSKPQLVPPQRGIGFFDSLYSETLVSPATYCTPPPSST